MHITWYPYLVSIVLHTAVILLQIGLLMVQWLPNVVILFLQPLLRDIS